jgi:hypothetical protein
MFYLTDPTPASNTQQAFCSSLLFAKNSQIIFGVSIPTPFQRLILYQTGKFIPASQNQKSKPSSHTMAQAQRCANTAANYLKKAKS